jgi:hypothetical protein
MHGSTQEHLGNVIKASNLKSLFFWLCLYSVSVDPSHQRVIGVGETQLAFDLLRPVMAHSLAFLTG